MTYNFLCIVNIVHETVCYVTVSTLPFLFYIGYMHVQFLLETKTVYEIVTNLSIFAGLHKIAILVAQEIF